MNLIKKAKTIIFIIQKMKKPPQVPSSEIYLNGIFWHSLLRALGTNGLKRQLCRLFRGTGAPFRQ